MYIKHWNVRHFEDKSKLIITEDIICIFWRKKRIVILEKE